MGENILGAIKTYYKSEKWKSCIRIYDAYSMADVYNKIEDIGQNVFKNVGGSIGRPLWFRGQEKEEYTLIPTLYRERDNSMNRDRSYSAFSLAEQYRHQNFAARVTHLIQSGPKNRVEWQEVLQHHLGKTRFMDWSESAQTAVDFALESFLDTKNSIDNSIKRSTATPGIWVLDPYKLNSHVYDFFAEKENLEYVIRALRSLFSDATELEKAGKELQDELKENKKKYFDFSEGEVIDAAINGLVSICVLDEHYHYNAENMKCMLKSREFNPFFFLLVRYYADALPVEAELSKNLLPPLASVQPYHSERIRAQRGTFTIFPNYCRSEEAKHFGGTAMDIIPIESQKYVHDCFCNIRLCDPVRVAKELIYAGERMPEIYPDVQVYANYLETQKFFL